MKLLFLTPSPPNELGRVRSLNILKALKSLNIEVTLVTLYNKKQEKYLNEAKPYVKEIKAIKYNRLIALLYAAISLFLPIPIRAGYCFNFNLRKYLKNNSDGYDAVYIKRLRMAQYRKYFKCKVYIDLTDSLTKYFERLYKNDKTIKKVFYFEEYLKHKSYEVKMCKENKNMIICSEDDKNYLVRLCENIKNNISVIKNVVDIENKVQKIDVKPIGNRTQLVFLGIMDYEPNILAVNYIIKHIMPNLSDDYTLTIIGPKVPDSLKKYENKRIKFLGYIEDVESELSKYDIFICPIIAGSGTKNKIIQAGIAGLPIVSNRLGIEGLGEKYKEVIYLAENSDDFVKKIREINSIPKKEIVQRLEKQVNIIKENNSLERLKNELADIIVQ